MYFSSINLSCFISLALIFINSGVFGYPQPSPIPVNTDSAIPSEHKCQTTDRAKPFRYHIPSGKCYQTKTKGPCDNNLKFYSNENSKVYGDCDCPLASSGAPWIYHEETNQCYQAFQQGYCSDGEWLVFDEETPRCTKNKCSDKIVFGSSGTTVLFNDKCAILFEPSPYCKENETIGFDSSDVHPSCIRNDLDYNLSNTSQLKCKPGTRRDVVGKCRTAIQSQSAFMKIGR